MDNKIKVAITGAAGNLGSFLANRLTVENIDLNLLYHNKEIDKKLTENNKVTTYKIDLAQKNTLFNALDNVDVIVHFAGVLFKANPEKFLPETNTIYFRNLLDMAVKQKVKRIILISFPHVEGITTPENPAKGSLDGNPISMHAKTRLEEEKLLFEYAQEYNFEPVSLRVGMVYGKGILMIDAALWFSKYHLLGVWKEPTWIHLISKTDFVDATTSAITKQNIRGIYHIGDEGKQTLQEFLDTITIYKKQSKPWRMPLWMINTAARIFETYSSIFNTKSPLTVDFITIGKVSYYGDTTKMREELLSTLKYKTFKEGLSTL